MGSLWHGNTAIERFARLLLNRNLLLLSLASLLTDIASEMTYPLLPMLAVGTLGATTVFFGVMEGTAESVAQVLRVGAGRLSDRLGRRKPLTIGGYVLGALGKVILGLATFPLWVFAGRIVDRLGKALRSPARDALIAESVDPTERGRAFGFHRAMDTTGAFLGVAAAWLILRAGIADVRPVFLWATLPAGLAVVLLLLVRETGRGRPASPADAPNSGWGHVWRSLPPALKRYLLIVFLFNIGNSSNQFLLLRAGERGLSPTEVVAAYGLFNLTYVLFAYPAGALADRVGPRRVLIAGYTVHAVTYAGLAAAHLAGPWAVWAGFALYGVHMALTEGVEKAMIVQLAPAEHRATVLGMFATAVGLALFPASALAGVLWREVSPSATFVLGAAAGALAAPALAVALRPRSHAAPAP